MLADMVRRFLAEAYLGVLSTVGATGTPHATVIWYVLEDEAIWFYVGRDSQKARNLRREPAVAITVDAWDWPYRQAVIYGTAEEAPVDPDRARRIATR